MTRREEYLEFVQGGRHPEVPLVDHCFYGGYVGEVIGRPATSVADFFTAWEKTGGDNFLPINYDYDHSKYNPRLKWRDVEEEVNSDGDKIITQQMETDYGVMERKFEVKPGAMSWPCQAPIRNCEDLKKVQWYAHQVKASIPAMEKDWDEALRINDGRHITYLLVLSPVEMFWLIGYEDQFMFYIDYPEEFLATMETVYQTNLAIIEAAGPHKIDLIGMGSAGYELFSPQIYKEIVMPNAKRMCDATRANGMMAHYHMCGWSKDFILQGVFNEIRPNILETLSPPPCGKVDDLAVARRALDQFICSKGNLQVELLRDGTPEQIVAATRKLCEVSKGWKHIVSIADTIMAGTPPENLKLFADTVQGYN